MYFSDFKKAKINFTTSHPLQRFGIQRIACEGAISPNFTQYHTSRNDFQQCHLCLL